MALGVNGTPLSCEDKMDRDALTSELITDEGIRLYAYDDASGMALKPGIMCKGHPTIGIGRALDVNGITQEEAKYLLSNDIDRVQSELETAFPWFTGLPELPQRVLANMCFNMGLGHLQTFKEMLGYVESGAYAAAATAMEDSLWAKQVGQRAVRLANMMRGATAA